MELHKELTEIAAHDYAERAVMRDDARTLLIEGISLTSESLKYLTDICYGLGLTAGWWHDPVTKQPKPDRNFGDLISLMHGELSESYEAHRKSNKKDDHLPQYDGRVVELADLAIRLFDAIGGLGMREQFAEAFAAKLLYNTQRADHKIDNRAADGGKKL